MPRPSPPDTGEILTIWDGHTTKPHPVTGKEVPDEFARTVLFDYKNPRRVEWPQADFIVGNPPFLGKGRLLSTLGEGYVTALRTAWKAQNPDSWDFVMFWWQRAAEAVRKGTAQGLGLITSNSIHQSFNRRCVEPFLNDPKKPLHLSFVIPDHPWVDCVDGAAVRIAMSVAKSGSSEGVLATVSRETTGEDGEVDVDMTYRVGKIAPDFKVGANTAAAVALDSNSKISCLGLILGGKGFEVPADLAGIINEEAGSNGPLARPIWNGSDITDQWGGNFAIDAFGLSEQELVSVSPTAWQHLKNTVFDIRQTNRDTKLRETWWLFRRANTEFRTSTNDLHRFIVTSETAKHRIFQFLGGIERPEHKLVVVASSDAAVLGTLSSTVHVLWALCLGGRLGVGNDPVYVKTRCFDPFPFPALEESPLKQRIRDLGERLDAHRKARQAAHSHLPLADLLARGGPAAEGLEQELLTRLVALNHQRAAEEKTGLIRWLRPDYQSGGDHRSATPQESTPHLPGTDTSPSPLKTENSKLETLPWPPALSEQVAAIQKLLPTTGHDPAALAARFGKRSKPRIVKIAEILETLATLGRL